MKLDIEGYEPYALLGATNLLPLVNDIIFEMNTHFICSQPGQSDHHCPLICDMWDLLTKGMGFGIVRTIGSHRRDSLVNMSTDDAWDAAHMAPFDESLSSLDCNDMLNNRGQMYMKPGDRFTWKYGIHFSVNIWMSKERKYGV
jgi:hypothetical protein